MASGYLLQEQLRQSRRAGDPIEQVGKMGEKIIGAFGSYYKTKLLADAEKRKATAAAYKESLKKQETDREKSLRPSPDRARQENLGRWQSAIESGRFRTFIGGKEIDMKVDTLESVDQVARYLGVDQDPSVLKYLKENTFVPAQAEKKPISAGTPVKSFLGWPRGGKPADVGWPARRGGFSPNKKTAPAKAKIKDTLGLGGLD